MQYQSLTITCHVHMHSQTHSHTHTHIHRHTYTKHIKKANINISNSSQPSNQQQRKKFECLRLWGLEMTQLLWKLAIILEKHPIPVLRSYVGRQHITSWNSSSEIWHANMTCAENYIHMVMHTHTQFKQVSLK